MSLHILNTPENNILQVHSKHGLSREERYSVDLGYGGKLKLYIKAMEELLEKLQLAILCSTKIAKIQNMNTSDIEHNQHAVDSLKEFVTLTARVRGVLKVVIDDCQISEEHGEAQDSLVYLRDIFALFLRHVNMFCLSRDCKHGEDAAELNKLLLRIFKKYLEDSLDNEKNAASA